jgi:hypothetical protein
MAPDRIEQLVARDQLVGSREQHEQHGKDFRLDGYFDCAAGQSPIRRIDAQFTALVKDVIHTLPPAQPASAILRQCAAARDRG